MLIVLCVLMKKKKKSIEFQLNEVNNFYVQIVYWRYFAEKSFYQLLEYRLADQHVYGEFFDGAIINRIFPH